MNNLNFYKTIAGISILIFSLSFLNGCENESTIESQGVNLPKVVYFTAEPSTVPEGGDTVKLSWIVNKANSLSISPGIGTVTPVDSGSIEIFVASSTVFKLTAVNTEGNVTADAQVTVVQPITVNGIVKDINDVPLVGVKVIIKGKNPVTTGAGGNFSVSNVTPPYEVGVIVSSVNTAMSYHGLMRSDPTLYYIGSTSSSKFAVINGNVPPAQGKYTLVFYVTDTKAWSTTADQTTGSFSINADWKGTTNSYTGNLQVLRWIPDSTGLPLQYDAYGFHNDLAISNGGTFGYYNFGESDFTDPAEKNISGSVTVPSASYSILYKSVNMNFEDVAVKLIGENGVSLTKNFNYVVPVISGVKYEVDANAQQPATPDNRLTFYRKMNINAGATGIKVNLGISPELTLPIYNASGVDITTQFSWAARSGVGVNLVRITPAFSGPKYYIFTTGNNTSIPDFSAQGFGLPANTAYEWSVYQLFPFSSMDVAASSNFTKVFSGSVESGYAISESFQFTSHP